MTLLRERDGGVQPCLRGVDEGGQLLMGPDADAFVGGL